MFNLLRNKSRDDKHNPVIQNTIQTLPESLINFLNVCPIQYKLTSYIEPLSKYDDTVYNGMVRQRDDYFEIEILNKIENEYLLHEVVLHEIGHIVDIFLGDKFYQLDDMNTANKVMFVSESTDMNVNMYAIERILNILLDEEDYSYFLQNEKEMFAELFALYYSKHYESVFKEYPSIQLLFNKIEKKAEEKFNSFG